MCTHNERRCLMLGFQRGGAAWNRGRRYADDTDAGSGWAHVQNDKRWQSPYVRAHNEWPGVLLGTQLRWPAWNREPRPPGDADSRHRWAEVRSDQRQRRAHLRLDNKRRGILLGGWLLGSARERNLSWQQHSDEGAGPAVTHRQSLYSVELRPACETDGLGPRATAGCLP